MNYTNRPVRRNMRGRGGGWVCIGCWGHQVCVFDRGEVGGGGRGKGEWMIYSQITCHFFFFLKAENLIETDVCNNRGTITRWSSGMGEGSKWYISEAAFFLFLFLLLKTVSKTSRETAKIFRTLTTLHIVWIIRDDSQRLCTVSWGWLLAEGDCRFRNFSPLKKEKKKEEKRTGPGPCCFTSTEARLLIRDGDGGGGGEEGERVKARPRIPPEKPPQRPWTAARTMEVLRRCPLAIAQRLAHCAVAVSTAVQGQSYKDNVRCTAVEKQPEAKEVQLSQHSSTSLLMISSGLTWGSSSTSLLLISPGALL